MITLVIDSSQKKDFYFLHSPENGIHIPGPLMIKAIFTSLRMKHDVFILQSRDLPTIDLKKRFNFGDEFIHLSPRFLSFLRENYQAQIFDFSDFRNFLDSSK